MHTTADRDTNSGIPFTPKRLTILRRLAYIEIKDHDGSAIQLAESLVIAKTACILLVAAMVLVIYLVQHWSA